MANVYRVPQDYGTITAAIAAASDYDTVRVAPGIYNEVIVVNKRIQLLGAQAGVDARRRVGTLASETIISLTANFGAIQIEADEVVIDGFMIEDNTSGAGIYSTPDYSGYWIFNNIIKNNAYGIYLNSSGQRTVQVRQCAFYWNNISELAGNGIFSVLGISNVLIEANLFAGSHSSATVNFGAPSVQNNITILNNEFYNDNSIALTNTNNVKIASNRIVGSRGSSIYIGGGTTNTDIEGNILHGSIYSAIQVTNAFSQAPNVNMKVIGNSISGNQLGGLYLHTGAYDASGTNSRLDATNNWWGSATGPGPVGGGDVLYDPDQVTESAPFLTEDPSPEEHFNTVLTTGVIHGAQGDPAGILIDILNEDRMVSASIDLWGFFLTPDNPKIPFAYDSISLGANGFTQRSFVTYWGDNFEFQFSINNTSNIVISIWGQRADGTLTPIQRLYASDLTPITGLSPVS